MNNQIAVVGIGNVLRSDDGLGNYIVEKIEELHIKNVKTFIAHQLHIELLEELKDFDSVIFVDASIKKEACIFKEVESNLTVTHSSSHQITAEIFARLSKKLYRRNTRFFVCAVKGYDFNMGEQISFQAKINAEKAVKKIVSFIQL